MERPPLLGQLVWTAQIDCGGLVGATMSEMRQRHDPKTVRSMQMHTHTHTTTTAAQLEISDNCHNEEKRERAIKACVH